MSDSLFNEFDSVSSKQWKQKIQFDLKGADYNTSLVWNSPEDIAVKPFYHSDEFKILPDVSSCQGTQWEICQEIYVSTVTQANTKALNVLNRGAESILFVVPIEAVSIYHLLKNINLSETTIHFKLQFLSDDFILRLTNYLRHKNATVFVNIDLLGNLTESGNWFYNLRQDHEILDRIMTHSESFKGTLSVDLSLYQNAGANMIQQLAYGLAHANEYLNHFKDIFATKDPDSFILNFKLAMGPNYFFEIAKIRALRHLYRTLASEYGITLDCHILAVPSLRNMSIYDYNNNMLRTTTECMSAILGGANTICNSSYDAIYHKDNEFGERISRNQLLILKHESYFDKVANPTDGAYYIETLTTQLAQKALVLFKDIESNGGFLKLLKEGTIQRKIKESALKEQNRFDATEEIILGTNKHVNMNNRMKNDMELYPFVKTNKRKTIIEPIIARRLAEKLEQERLKNEN